MERLLDLLVLALGSVVGSFANVCIHRLPRGESVVRPPSHCPACGARVRPRDNVPVLGWVLLRGRCRDCHASIPVRYPLVEGGMALLFLTSLRLFGPTPEALGAGILAWAAVVLAATDLEHRVLPDEVTLGGLGLGLIVAPLRGGTAALVEALAGAAGGAALLLLVRVLYKLLRGGEGMGLGDVKMAAMIGAIAGPAGLLVTFLLASVGGVLFGFLSPLTRTMAWTAARRSPASIGAGLLLDSGGRIAVAGRSWSELPGAAPSGAFPRDSGPALRPLVALLRLAARRARAGAATFAGRLAIDDGDFFRVLAARVEPADGGTRLLLWRVDLPFGIFLAAGSLLAFALGRGLLSFLGWPEGLLGGLLP